MFLEATNASIFWLTGVGTAAWIFSLLIYGFGNKGNLCLGASLILSEIGMLGLFMGSFYFIWILFPPLVIMFMLGFCLALAEIRMNDIHEGLDIFTSAGSAAIATLVGNLYALTIFGVGFLLDRSNL